MKALDRLTVVLERETEAQLVKMVVPHKIEDGYLVGSEICIQDGFYRVWTDKTNYARRLHKKHGFKFRELTDECEVWLPMDIDLSVLKKFGAFINKASKIGRD